MTRYRRLPGARRGFLKGSSVWLGDDHLLLVKSSRFREEYKRFYLRDVQAIAVAEAPRFHISTRSAAMAVLLLILIRIAGLATPIERFSFEPYLWGLLALLFVAWIYISAASSCRCRIYTAVSADELPSVYRSWTARKFLAAVEPKIAEVQGVIEGEWAEAAETRNIGPPLPGSIILGPAAAALPAEPVVVPSHTLTSDLLVAALFASGLVSFLTLGAPPNIARIPAIGFIALKVGLSLMVFVQHYKGKLQGGMQRVAIANLLVMGLMFYVQQIVEGFRVGAETANKQAMAQVVPVMVSGNRFAAEVDGGASLLLGCIGLGVVLLARDRQSQ